MQRKSPVWSQPLSFFKLRNNTQKGTRVVTGQAIKPQVDRQMSNIHVQQYTDPALFASELKNKLSFSNNSSY